MKSSKRPAVLRALDFIQEHLEKTGYKTLYCTTNKIATFWKARAEATIKKYGDAWEITTDTPLSVRLPHRCEQVLLDGKPTNVFCKTIGEESFFLLPITSGTHFFSFE